jgi:hypothetical protein
MVPMFFVIGILLTATVGFVAHGLWWPFILLLSAYVGFSLIATILITRRERDPRVIVFLPLVFAILHISYGLGSLWGALRSLRPLAKHLFGMKSRRVKLKEAGGSPT